MIRKLLIALVMALILVLLAAAAVLLGALAFIGVGSVISRLVGLGVFESSVIAALSGMIVIYLVTRIVIRAASPLYELDDEEDWEEEEPSLPAATWRPGKPESTPPRTEPPTPAPAPSKRTRKR